jgi:hypothetical protein
LEGFATSLRWIQEATPEADYNMSTDKSKSVKMPTHLMHEAQEAYNDLDLVYTSL